MLSEPMCERVRVPYMLFAFSYPVYVLPRGIRCGFARDWAVYCLLFGLLVYPLSDIL